jgi:hypothetical protein
MLNKMVNRGLPFIANESPYSDNHQKHSTNQIEQALGVRFPEVGLQGLDWCVFHFFQLLLTVVFTHTRRRWAFCAWAFGGGLA